MGERPKMRSQVAQDTIRRKHDSYQTEKAMFSGLSDRLLFITSGIHEKWDKQKLKGKRTSLKTQHFKKQKTPVGYIAVMKLCPEA